MIINITYDPSVASAPAGFKTAVAAAAAFYEDAISTNITVNISFGWGEVGGQAMDADALGESIPSLIEAGFSSNLSSGKQQAAFACLRHAFSSFPADPITNNHTYVFSSAQAKAKGLINATDPASDGSVGLSSDVTYSFDPNHRAVAGEYDAIGTLEHEIGHVLGRLVYSGEIYNQTLHLYSTLDLFRYLAAGEHTYVQGPSFLSLNGEQMLLPFNDGADGADSADWADPTPGDAFSAYGDIGVQDDVSAIDLREMTFWATSCRPPPIRRPDGQ